MKTMIACIVLSVLPPAMWLTDFETAKAAARAENKYVLLNFSGSDWCAPCIKLKKEVFESDAFNSLAQNKLVLVRADFPRSKKNQLPKDQLQHNEALAEKYNPDGKFPLTVLLDSNGNVVKEWDGYVFASQDKFIAELEKSITTE